MKRLLLAILTVFFITSVAHAEVRLGTAKKPSEDKESQTTWAHPNAPAIFNGIMNSTGATKAFKTISECDRGMIEFGDITGSGIMNVAVQTAPFYDPEKTGAQPPFFYNSIGSTSTPYHQLDPSDSDTYKFDFNSRAWDWWRIYCLAGCTTTNYVETIHGDCRKEGE